MSDEEETAALRPSARPLVTGLVANAVLGVLLLGLPYLRGRERARESARGVVELSACLLDGRPREELGLALPLGERDRFATLFEQAPPDWPGRCSPILGRIDHEPATFILPSPKAAELELSESLEDMGAALLDLTSARAAGRGGVPERPLEALGQLRGFAAALLIANDLSIDPTAIALDLGPIDAELPTPSRIPLRTGAGTWHIRRGEDPVVRVVAADGLGIAEVEVGAVADPGDSARVRVLQLRRPGGARGVLVGAEDAWLAWVTAQTTCDADERHCAMRATGLGRLLDGSRVMRPEHWIAAHPGGAPDRSLFVGAERFTIVATTPDGGLEARVFPRGEPLPAPEPGSATAEHPSTIDPTRAEATRPLAGAIDWIVEDARVHVLTQAGDGSRSVTSLLVGTEPAADTIVTVAGEAQHLLSCGAFLVAVSTEGAQVIAAGLAWPPIEIAPRPPIRGPSEDESSVRLACDEGALALGVLDARRRLTVYLCQAGSCVASNWPTVPVETFDVAVDAGRSWAATSGGEDAPQILIAPAPFDEEPRVLAACWESGDGMCGPARFADGDVGPLVVAAREGSDVLALALGPEGFGGLRGLVSVSSGP